MFLVILIFYSLLLRYIFSVLHPLHMCHKSVKIRSPINPQSRISPGRINARNLSILNTSTKCKCHRDNINSREDKKAKEEKKASRVAKRFTNHRQRPPIKPGFRRGLTRPRAPLSRIKNHCEYSFLASLYK